MPTAGPSIGVIRAQIRAIRNKAQNAKVFGIYTPARWTGPSVQGEGADKIAIYQCDSPLQMRLALQSAPARVSATVLVTPLDQAKVSEDILRPDGTAEAPPDQQLGDRPIAVHGQAFGSAHYAP